MPEWQSLAPYAVGLPGTVFVLWVLGKISNGDWKTKGHHEEVLRVREESEQRAWDAAKEARGELRETTKVVEQVVEQQQAQARAMQELAAAVEKLGQVVASQSVLIQALQGTKR